MELWLAWMSRRLHNLSLLPGLALAGGFSEAPWDREGSGKLWRACRSFAEDLPKIGNYPTAPLPAQRLGAAGGCSEALWNRNLCVSRLIIFSK